MNVDERMAGEHLADVLLLLTLKLDTRQHGEALVRNTLLEVVVSVQVLLSGRSWHRNGLPGHTIDQMGKETVSIMCFIVAECTIELGLDIGDVNKVPISDQISWSPLLREHVVENVTERFDLHTLILVGVSHEISDKGLVMGQKLENSLHIAINSVAL